MGLVCDVQPLSAQELSFDPRSASRARAFVRSTVCPVHQSQAPDDAELLVSELVTNGVRYGAPPLVLSVECLGQAGSRVSVQDGGAATPRLLSVDDSSEKGRGLRLVDVLSESWGVQDEPQGKTTWFRIGASASSLPH